MKVRGRKVRAGPGFCASWGEGGAGNGLNVRPRCSRVSCQKDTCSCGKKDVPLRAYSERSLRCQKSESKLHMDSCK